MPVKKVYTFNELPSIPVFCFNNDMKRLALSPNNSEVHIYCDDGGVWKLESILTEHSERVTGIDWSKGSNKLLTCAADRNAYVWTEEKSKEWKQSLVLLRVDRAAIFAKWAPSEKKFAVGTGSKLICVCYYEENNDWWVSKHIKKPIRSSVICGDWHPAGTALAAGSTDFYVRVYSAGVKEIEKKPEATPWGDKLAFGALLAEFKTQSNGWVHSISFSPSGNKLVWVAHDSTISVADTANGSPVMACILKLSYLPFESCLFLSESVIIAAGHNNSPYKFSWDGKAIMSEGDIDTGPSRGDGEPAKISAMSKFRNMDNLAQTSNVETASTKKTHANTITLLVKLANNQVASSGLDSKIAIWQGC